LPIKKFPFRIGRESNDDPLAHNDLNIPDSVPFQVSRHHVTLVNHGGHIGVMDRGNTLGAIVDGQPLGGKHGDPSLVYLGVTGGTLILGTEESPFRFQLIVGRERDVPSDWQPPSPSEKRSLLKKLFERWG
jgi:pSer/pThr/pTyr-binding forkhead associated (FHA) protein